MQNLTLAALFIANVACADDAASVAYTPGIGRLEIITDYLVFSSGTSYDAKIPTRVETGSTIQVQYKDGSRSIQVEFAVAEISAKGEMCWLYNRLRSQVASAPPDTIFVKPCRHQ